jgi:hypothetical protein
MLADCSFIPLFLVFPSAEMRAFGSVRAAREFYYQSHGSILSHSYLCLSVTPPGANTVLVGMIRLLWGSCMVLLIIEVLLSKCLHALTQLEREHIVPPFFTVQPVYD